MGSGQAAAVVIVVALAALGGPTWWVLRTRSGLAAVAREPGTSTAGRPIEQVASDLRRLAATIDAGYPHLAPPQAVATVLAYDHALREACAALGVAEQLDKALARGEIEPERARVEAALATAGLVVRATDDR